MKSNVQSNPYGLELIKEKKGLEKERIENSEKLLREVVDALRNIGDKLDIIEDKINK